MAFTAIVLKVMIASPGDVLEERQAIREIILDWNNINAESQQLALMPTGWDTHSFPLMGDRPQAIINEQVAKGCDLLVAVFWTRLGSPTGDFASGTVKEIESHLRLGKPAMIYFSSKPVRPESVDGEQYKALKSFKDDCRDRGLIETFDSVEEFKTKFVRQLAQTVIRELGDSMPEVNGSQAAGNPERPLLRNVLTDIAKEILLKATKCEDRIIHSRTSSGTSIQVCGENLIPLTLIAVTHTVTFDVT